MLKVTAAPAPLAAPSDFATAPDLKFLRAARGESLPVPPVWLMRQAGRYLPEYLELRSRHDFITVCRTPELASEVTLQPIRRFGFDAAILFSDILLPAIPLGPGLRFDTGHGPVIERPLRTAADVRALRRFDPRNELADVLAAVTMIRRELPAETALIGFAGAPFTLATYLIEGGRPDPFTRTKQMMYGDPRAFRELLTQLGTLTADYLAAMVESGADALQLFDTWAGSLTAAEFRAWALPVLQDIFSRLNELKVPLIYFALNGSHLLDAVAATGCTVAGVDWRVPLPAARATLGPSIALQGNLDPVLLLTNEQTIRTRTREIIEAAAGGGFIFNLGHGILPSTPLASVEVLLDTIRSGS